MESKFVSNFFVVENFKSASATLLVEHTAFFPSAGHSAEEDERAVDPGPAQPRLRRHQDHEQQPQLPDHLRTTGREQASSFFWFTFIYFWGDMRVCLIHYRIVSVSGLFATFILKDISESFS